MIILIEMKKLMNLLQCLHEQRVLKSKQSNKTKDQNNLIKIKTISQNKIKIKFNKL